MSQADFDKFLKLEKRLGKLIDNPTGSSSRALMKRKENLRRRLKVLEPKIKGFEEGGDVAKPKAKPKNFTKTVQKQKRDRAIASGDMTIGDFNEMTPSMMQDFYKDASKVKRKKFGGKVQKMREGGSAMSDADRAMIQALLGESGKTISDADRARMARMMGEFGKNISDADRAKMMMSSGIGKGMKYGGKVKKMKLGGEAVPSKFKGFSKLPEGVQQKIDPKLASKYEVGGEATPIKNKTKAQKQMDDYKKRTADSLAKTEKGRELVKMGISSGFGSDISEFTKKKKAERISNKMKKKIPVKKMEMGGKVEKYGGGGKVKGGKMSCRGMGAAIKGGGFSIR